jgi:hypothetical protein
VADEQTTPPDSTSSETNETVAETTEQQAAPNAETGEATADEADGETSVLGGDVTDEGKPEDETAEEAAPAGPPEKYELALKDADGNDITLDAEAVQAAEPVFRELNLTNEQAQKLMPVAKDFAERTQQATLAQIIEAGANQKKDWLDAFKADPEIGGAKADETTHLAAKGLDALGFPEGSAFRKALTETGFGNHPDMIRAFRKVGEMVGEDGFERASTSATDKPDRLSALYPDDVPKK